MYKEYIYWCEIINNWCEIHLRIGTYHQIRSAWKLGKLCMLQKVDLCIEF